MKKTAKIFALGLTLVMVIGIACACVINANAAAAPSLNVTETSKSGNKVTVAVNLTSGEFNSLDFKFNTSSGVTCDSISASGGYGNPANGKVSMASVNPYTGGSVITATFTVPEEGDYSITGSASSCSVTENGGNVEVTPNISGGAHGTNSKPTEKPTTKKTDPTTKKTDPTKSTTKKTDPTKSTAKTTTKATTTRKGQPSTKPTTTKKGQTTTSTTIPTTDLDKDALAKEEENVTLPEDEDVFGDDVIDAEGEDMYSDYDYSDDETEAEDGEEKKPVDNKKAIALIGGSAAVLIGGAVTGIVLANKKKKDEDNF